MTDRAGDATARPVLMPRPVVLPVLAWLEVLGWSLAGLIALGVGAISVSEGQSGAGRLSLAVALFAGLHLGAAIGLLRLQGWARRLRLALGWVGLLGFPVLTLFSIVVLGILLPRGMLLICSGRRPADLDDGEWALVERSASTNVAVIVAGVVAVAVIPYCGIFSAIAIPNLLNAIDRGKQKRTLADLRSLGTAIESYAIDHDHYPRAGDIAALAAVVEPLYLRTAPRVDGWARPFEVASTPDGYELRSAGKDGLIEDAPPAGATLTFDADIVFRDGELVQWPGEWGPGS